MNGVHWGGEGGHGPLIRVTRKRLKGGFHLLELPVSLNVYLMVPRSPSG